MICGWTCVLMMGFFPKQRNIPSHLSHKGTNFKQHSRTEMLHTPANRKVDCMDDHTVPRNSYLSPQQTCCEWDSSSNKEASKAISRPLRWPSPTSRNSSSFCVRASFTVSSAMNGCPPRWPLPTLASGGNSSPSASKGQGDGKANSSLDLKLHKKQAISCC